MTDVDNLDDLANAISQSSPKIKAYAVAQAAATQSQELEIRDALARIATLEATPPPEPEPSPEPTPSLPFAEAVLVNPIRPVLPVTQTSFTCETGKDYLFDLGMTPRPTLVLTGAPRNVHIANYYCRPSSSGSAYWRGGIGLQLLAEHISLTGYYTESVAWLTDAIRIACKPTTKVTIQKALVEMPSDSTEALEHIDCLQTQGAVGKIEVGLSSFQVAGVRPPNHGGKGFQLDVLSAIGQTGGPFSVDVRKVDFELLANSQTGARSIMAIGKDDNSAIQIALNEVYGSGSLAFENHLVNYPSALGKTITGVSPDRVMTFTNPAQGWSGEYRERGSRPHFVTREMLGV